MEKLQYQRKTSLLHIQGSTAAAAPMFPPVKNPSGFCVKPQGCRETAGGGRPVVPSPLPARRRPRVEDELGRLRAPQRSEANGLHLALP